MNAKKRVLVCEFHQETNTFNPMTGGLELFQSIRYAEGQKAYALCKNLPCAFHGMIDAIEEAGGEVIPTISLYGGSWGLVKDSVTELLYDRMRHYVAEAGEFDAVFASMHGATCTESEEDACGAFLAFLRELAGEDKIIAASYDLHANITAKSLRCADVICGYQSYPHVDFYETGYRAASLGMRKLMGKPVKLAAATIPMMTPPAGYTSLEEPFKSIIDYGKSLVASGTLLDFSVFNVQPWLDISMIGCTIIAVAEDEAMACHYADELSKRFFDNRDGYWPDLMSVDEVIDRAEDPASAKPVILMDSADSPNGGAVGDSVVVALRLLERRSKVTAGMFVKDSEAVKKAFEVGVGNTAVFTVGARYTPGMPGPLVAEGRVRSLHDGFYLQEGPAGKGFPCHIGLSAVIRFGNIDVMVCEKPTGSGDPQILRHFGIEPKVYDLIVVKANTSFRLPYSDFAGEICAADTPGAGASNLKGMDWKNLPKNFYPFDLEEGYTPEAATIRRS